MSEPFDDERFCRFYMKMFKKLHDLEKVKYLDPKFSRGMKELAGYIIVNKEEMLGPGRGKSSLNLSVSSIS